MEDEDKVWFAAAVRTSELCRPATSHAVAGKQ